MKTSKKSDVGLVKVSTPLNGENKKGSKDLSVRIVGCCLLLRIDL
jgi:hypothetical protein